MSVEIDELYVAHIKSMFDQFDDEIIWTAIYERGYDTKGDFNLENVVNYLLELSNNSSVNNNKKEETKGNIENEDKNNTITNLINAIPNLFIYGSSNSDYTALNQDIEKSDYE